MYTILLNVEILSIVYKIIFGNLNYAVLDMHAFSTFISHENYVKRQPIGIV